MPSLFGLRPFSKIKSGVTVDISKSSAPESKGFCLYCEEKTSREKRWCNTFCRDDWQRNEDSRRRKLGIAPVSMPIDDTED